MKKVPVRPKTWAEVKAVLVNDRNEISLIGIHALHFETLCRICYDPATPEGVVQALKAHVDASVRGAANQRNAVLAGVMANPFTVLPQ